MNEPQIQIYEFGKFRLDATKRLLLRDNGESVPLTPKVFDTLLYLVQNAGKIIEKDELMREIWTDTVVEENNLSQNISILRRVLGEKRGEHRFIATIPGQGFKFVASVEVSSSKFQVPSLVESEIEHLKLQNEPENNNKPESRNLKPETNQNRSQKIFAFAALVLLIAVGAAVYFWQAQTKSVSSPIKTVAVLPFKPLVAVNRDEALEIGMADTLISQLGNNREIIVRPLSSVRKFGNLEQDANSAGRELGVDAILDGSIQRWGDKIRVNIRLVKVFDGTLLWTGTFDEKFTDIFVVQDVISNRVAAALALRLGGDEKMRLTKRYTENVEAYQLYLRGRFHIFKLTPPEMNKGISYFQQAIAIDPNYALAYAGIADAYRSLALGGEMLPTEFLPKSKAAAQKAIEIDETLSEAHTALGMTIFWYDWDWNEAENQFRRALELNPNSAEAHLFYAHLLSNTGRHAEALFEIKLARELDPLFPFANALEGLFLIHAGQTDEALARVQKTVELEPNFWMPYLFASWAYIEKEMYAEAINEARRARKLSPVQTTAISFDGYALAKSGKRDEARVVLNELLKLSTGRFVSPSHIALVYNGLGEQDETFAWLERGFQQRDPKMTFLKVDPKWNNLRSEPRFIDLMRRMNF
ncbi:MAG: winged helix-turn-helix domain-containing protein [Acidobacteria bacterium]|jgi:DNA-binding winged helix-turn-helix (wHTH) protein/TolB-like protein/tetratricopeptide (TPR) repeat protein|nr:winged helix-turn-helix domain-containing protein [Acidobacteriota bacterium]